MTQDTDLRPCQDSFDFRDRVSYPELDLGRWQAVILASLAAKLPERHEDWAAKKIIAR